MGVRGMKGLLLERMASDFCSWGFIVHTRDVP